MEGQGKRKSLVPTEEEEVEKLSKQKISKDEKESKQEIEVCSPKDWETVYEEIKKMRKLVVAPVDKFGCKSMADPSDPEEVR
jgi:hypothetical protein